ncbi:MAG: hypothetical protein NZ601_02095 [candidate division WOR-3 bacterium]|nr:hypothetical protein [candidate division WOR-3 bacterium]MCX7757615.1 hypothetical protein [candidate division WOR-3 bacterium]
MSKIILGLKIIPKVLVMLLKDFPKTVSPTVPYTTTVTSNVINLTNKPYVRAEFI